MSERFKTQNSRSNERTHELEPVYQFTVALRTTNPNNGAYGTSRNAMFARARARKAQRSALRLSTQSSVRYMQDLFGKCIEVTVTRIAPSNGLDPHDGLGAALKGAIDGIADGLGLKNDRDPRVRWILKQRRGKGYGVEVSFREASNEDIG